MPTRILIADDHPLALAGMRSLLALHDFDVVGDARDGIGAIEQAVSLTPDVVILDLDLPRLSGCAAAAEIRSRLPVTKVMLHSEQEWADLVVAAREAGAHGFLLKRDAPEIVLRGIESVLLGNEFISPSVVPTRLAAAVERVARRAPFATLTARDRQILLELASAATSKEIAEAIGVSLRTIEANIGSLARRLGTQDRHELIAYAIRVRPLLHS